MNEKVIEGIIELLSKGGTEASIVAKWYLLLNSPALMSAMNTVGWLITLSMVLFVFVRWIVPLMRGDNNE